MALASEGSRDSLWNGECPNPTAAGGPVEDVRMARRCIRLGLVAMGVPWVHGCAVTVGPGEFSAGITVGVGLFLLANVLYLKMRLEDEPSALSRILAFVLGLPTTFLLFLLIEPQDSWIQRRLDRGARVDPDEDLVEVQRDFDRELQRMRIPPTSEPDLPL
jgi:hypothetical protein